MFAYTTSESKAKDVRLSENARAVGQSAIGKGVFKNGVLYVWVQVGTLEGMSAENKATEKNCRKNNKKKKALLELDTGHNGSRARTHSHTH